MQISYKIKILMTLCLSSIYVHAQPLINPTTTIEVSSIPPTINTNEINNIVEQFILNNPEILIKSLNQFKAKTREEANKKLEISIIEQEKAIKAMDLPYLGNKQGDLEIIMFYDYNCSYCKKLNDTLNSLVSQDESIKITLVPLALLGKNSLEVVKYTLAIHSMLETMKVTPFIFSDFHNQLMKLTHPSISQIDEIVTNLGIVPDEPGSIQDIRNSNKITQKVSQLNNIASKLMLNGVPVLLIDKKLYIGSDMSLSNFQNLAKKIRTNRSNIGKEN